MYYAKKLREVMARVDDVLTILYWVCLRELEERLREAEERLTILYWVCHAQRGIAQHSVASPALQFSIEYVR